MKDEAKTADPTRARRGGAGHMSDRKFKSGYATLAGLPNAGKSALLNAIVGEKVSIVSHRPQTTRNRILGIYNADDCQIVFVDTPGLFKPRNALGEYMMRSVGRALNGTDCAIYVVDAERGATDADAANAEKLVARGLNVAIAVNKIDRVDDARVFETLRRMSDASGAKAFVPVSALKRKNIDALLDETKKFLTEGARFFDPDAYTDRSMRFMASEIVREKALRLLSQEVPYGVGVEIREFRERENGVVFVSADVVCEKARHRPIILGKNGAMIKKISTLARIDLERLSGKRVYLDLFARAKPGWRDDESAMRNLGYDLGDPN